MSTTDDTLAAVEQAVLAVPGVAELYRARPTVGSAVAAVRSLASGSAPTRVALEGDVLRVVIGTDGSRPAPETAHAAHLAAYEAATARGVELSRVDVRVARIG
ncbi:hypothetical protein Csp2054_02275 [Curtobacterium sp. 'Ferrero']|uniref:hypothetical protein n=1 Tax=Curtobacterium sp. 'Ferrero' TaxID=2033654 RepID=UPI000BC95B70|nr:hypothetical protein [Curtobacterium sp. 'Ferrero']PCN49048.1 hypothetical protein Csp2054_02275 [Curtobacterium sp. 'Ferrero']